MTLKCELCGWHKPPLYRHVEDYKDDRVTTLCKRCHNEVHGIRFKLLEVFKEHEVFVEGKSRFGKYTALYKVVPTPRERPLTVGELKNYVENLRAKYPDKNFVLQRRKIKDREFWVVTKLRIDVSGNEQRDIVPLYFDLEGQRVYVPKAVVKAMPKLANYIIMVTLGSLKMSQSKYVSMMGREQS